MIPERILSTFARLRKGRLIFLFVLCVLLPTIPLAYFAMRSIVGEREGVGRKIADSLERVSLSFTKKATAGLVDCEVDLGARLESGLTLNETVQEITEVLNSCSVFDSFFILDSHLEPLFPFGILGAKVSEIAIDGGENDKFTRGMREGNEKEFGSGDLEGAIGDYRLALAYAGGKAYRTVVENAIARCYFKQKGYREARNHYRAIWVKGDANVFYGGLSLKLLAMYRLAVIDGLVGHRGRAVERFLDVIKALAAGELAGSIYEAMFYASMAEKRVNELLGSPELARKYGAEFKGLLKLWRYRKRASLEMEEFQETDRFDFQKLLGERGDGARDFRRISKNIGGGEAILLYRKLSGWRLGKPVILAVVLDTRVLRREVGGALRSLLKSEGDVNIVVYDSAGREVAEGGDGASSSGYKIDDSTLAPALPFWQLKVAYRKQGLLFEVATRERMMRLTSISFLVAVVFLGIYVTYRSIKRDTELAKLKSDFVSRVSHELRTPRATIRAVGEMLEMGAVLGRDKEKEYFSLIASESERLSRLIDNVLDFSKIGTDKKRWNFKPADIGKVVSKTVERYQQYVKPDGFDIAFELDGDMPKMVIDEDAIGQVLINLLDNAVKFSRDEKVVWVELRRRGAELALSVRDSGIGIAPENLDRIFDQFYRPKEAIEFSAKGAGIGLAIVKNVAEAHGGRIDVQSDQGEGSIFTLVLPIAGPNPRT